MQNFALFQDSDYVSDAPDKLNGNFKSIASDFKGSSFPIANLFEGMKCLRSDENKMYRLGADLKTWIYEYSIVAGGISVSSADNSTNAINATNATNATNAVNAINSENALEAEKAKNVTGVVSIANGGTGATTPLEALSNLGVTFSNVDLESGVSELPTGTLYFVYD